MKSGIIIKQLIWVGLLTGGLAAVSNAQITIGNTGIDTATLVSGLDTPWEILWGPDDNIWMTERIGRVSTINPETGARNVLLIIDEVHEQSESGLLGMALHPAFDENGFVYLVYNYYTRSRIWEKLVRYTFADGVLTDPITLVEDILGSANHIGSRLIFGQDTTLYMTTGDAVNTSTSQDTASLSGKTLRMNPDGSIPDDNPFPGSYVWTYGHRNAQGLVFSDSGLLYSSEHGPANDDELNLIQKSGNYGWPEVNGFCDQATEIDFCNANQVIEPLAAWTPTLAVAGIGYFGSTSIPEWNHSILMVSLKAGRLNALKLSNDGFSVVSETEHFVQWWGRLRDLCIAPDGRVFIATSNQDGRGDPRAGDDRIVEIKASSSTGELPNAKEDILISPNPLTNDLLIIKNLPALESQISIFDIAGKRVHQSVIGRDVSSITIEAEWSRGIYFLHLQNATGTALKKIIKH